MSRVIRKITKGIKHPVLALKICVNFTKKIVLNTYYSLCYGKKIILFESHYEFNGNSGALWQYLRKDRYFKNYTFVWFVNDFKRSRYKNKRRDLVFDIREKTLKTKYFISQASFCFFDDIPIKPRGKNSKTIYLTHSQIDIKNVRGIIVIPDWVDYTLCISEFSKERKIEMCNLLPEKAFICGMPRNDILYQKHTNPFYVKDKYNKVILWLPTFRKTKSSRNDSNKELPFSVPLFYDKEDFVLLNNYLKKNNVLLVIKFHPIQDLSNNGALYNSNIMVLSHADLATRFMNVNALFTFTDALISDYSSVYIDYLLTFKPIAFVVEDLNNYKLAIPKEEYECLTPGDKISNINHFYSFIDNVIDGVDKYKDERSAFTKKVHAYFDGNNCRRIVEIFDIKPSIK